MPRLEDIAKAIDPAAWAGFVMDDGGNEITDTRKAEAREAAKRVLALLRRQSD